MREAFCSLKAPPERRLKGQALPSPTGGHGALGWHMQAVGLSGPGKGLCPAGAKKAVEM